MAYILKVLYGKYDYVMNEVKDPRTADWFMVLSAPKMVVIMLSWLWFVKDVGPQWMKNRQPFNLDKIMIVYNTFQIIYCIVLLYLSYDIILFQYNWSCEPVDYSRSETAMKIAGLVWAYYVLKLIDLLDTVFFVLRKKDNQLTFLHLYHHFGMVATVHAGVKWFPGGHSVYIGFLNCIVHVVMYFYYLLSAWDHEYKQSAWWKKHITQLQLVQFMLILYFYVPNLFMSTCPLPKFVSLYVVTQNLVMLLLFGDFYYKTYIKKRKTKSERPAEIGKQEDRIQGKHKQDSVETTLERSEKNARSR